MHEDNDQPSSKIHATFGANVVGYIYDDDDGVETSSSG